LTDIRDPKIDEKPPPYECSSCGYSTWSWNEAKHHICHPESQKASKQGVLAEIQELRNKEQSLPYQTVEELVRMTLETRKDHPDWSEQRVIQTIIKSLDSNKIHN
jgi:hypothetical protein